jgi:hypothetical protein
VDRPVRAGSVAFAAVITIGCVAIPPVVAILWPGLASGNTAARLALLVTYPLVLSSLVTNVFYAMNRQVVQIVITLGGAAVAFGLAQAFVHIHPTIAAPVSGSVVGLWVYYLLIVLAAYKAMLGSIRAAVPLIGETLLPAIVGVALVVGTDVALVGFGPAESVLRGVVAELIVVIVFGPWVWRAIRRLRAGN